MEPHQRGTPFHRIVEDAKNLILELKIVCDNEIGGREGRGASEKVHFLEQAFKEDCGMIFQGKVKPGEFSDSGVDLTVMDSSSVNKLISPKAGNIPDLQTEVDAMTDMILMLQRGIVETQKQQQEKVEKAGEGDCRDANTTVTMEMGSYNDNNSMSDAINGSFSIFEEDEVDDVNTGMFEAGGDFLDVGGHSVVNAGGKDRVEVDQSDPDLDPCLLTEPSFTQIENTFDKCIDALKSYECDADLVSDQEATNCNAQKYLSISSKEETSHWPYSSNCITSSDNVCLAASKPFETTLPEVDSQESISKRMLITTLVDQSLASKTSKLPSHYSPGMTTGTDACALACNTSKANYVTDKASDVIPSLTDPYLRCAAGDVEVEVDQMTTNDAKRSTDALEGFTLWTGRWKPVWVLTLSDRIRRSQDLVAKARIFASSLNCRLTSHFSFSTSHLVVTKGEGVRQVDLYEALASNRPVVSFDWILESLEKGKLLDHEPYLIGKRQTSGSPRDIPIFKNFRICCISPFDGFSKDDSRRLVEICGASYILDPALFVPSGKQHNILLVGEDDYDPRHECIRMRAGENSENFEVLSKEWFLHSIQQGEPLETHKFKSEITS